MAGNLVNSVRKALDILDILVFEDFEGKGLGLFDLSRKTDIKPNTLHNLLKTMVSCGYVQQNTESKYMAGPKCANIGMLNTLSPGSAAYKRIEDIIKELGRKIDEAIVFTVLADGLRLPLLKVDHENPIKIDIASIENEHIYRKDTGRVLTAYADTYSLERILERWGLPEEKWNGIKDRAAFKKVLEEVRSKGFSLSYLREGDIVSMAVPVLSRQDRLIGSMGSYAPAFRCNNEKQQQILFELKQAAEKIGQMVWVIIP